jgi:murein L,D-transpeptidase YcbB/YkuD
MDTVIQKDSLMIQSGDTAFVQTELRMTKEFFEFARKNGDGMINADNIYFVVPAKKMAPMELADSILHKQRDSAFYARHNEYMALKKGLALYYQAAKNGGWQPLPAAQRLARGTKSPAVVALKKRLSATGDYSAADTTNVFSDSLVAAIKDYQLRHGLLASGQVNDSLISALNVPAEERVQQILVNLNRVLWMQPLNDSSRIIVNIPSYTLYAYSDSGKAMEMPIIAGKQGTSTVMFTDEISQLVFAPYWRLPQSIVRNEIMPKLQQDPNYLKKRNMEIVKQNDSLPEIRQLPGKDNALGKVKFLFPNSFDIYLHDTPDKSLFAQKNRALSHGCIRVADPLSLAQFILGDQGDWTKEKIMQAMNSDKEQTVAVKKKVPVQINYYTAWSDNNGRIHFRNDVYGHDQVTKQRMFGNSRQTTGSVAQR